LKGGKLMTTSHYVVVDCRMCQEFFYIPATPEQQEEMDKPRSERKFMQDIFPELPIEDRELLISGTCGTCWDKLFPHEEGDE
jgi:hypothetical protein